MRRASSLGLLLLFVACSADGPRTYGPVFDAAVKDVTSDAPVADGAADASDGSVDAQADASTCVATTVILAGNGSTLVGASAKGTAALASASLAGSVTDRVSVVPFGAGFLGVARAADDSIVSTVFGGASWSAATAVGVVTTRDAPVLAVTGAIAHLVYQQKDFKFYHGQYTASAWDAATDPVGVGVAQSYGPRGPGFAAVGTTPVVLQAGDDGFLYDRDDPGGVWTVAHQQAATSVEKTEPPALVALTGGSAELLGVYLRQTDFKIMSVTRTSGTWAGPVLLDVNAYANEPVHVAPMSGGRALLAYRGSDGKAYFSVYDPTKSPVWGIPAALGSTAPLVESAPAIAPGVCGDDAVVAYAATGGAVSVTRFAGGTFGPAVAVTGTSGAKYVGIATRP